MSEYQYSSIIVKHAEDRMTTYMNISNLTEEDEDGFVEFDSTHDITKQLPGSDVFTEHVRTRGEIVEFVELV